ncbi:hypothetical protein QEH56_24080 [Pelagicoccus enzymogenes]|uniref:hypothetical protein n=1 Tax=Pelagicoccus enzymogenes TaxID=2773457 RepID=UPI00280DE941|nr:hypothetical protein [Pelagicoccus enzymogenes]MDQ8201265.1 hypothetical protein [Pelagicoccus enzymogenes]
MLRLYRKGAEQRAAQLGFRLYDFWLADPEMSSARLRDILLARGIRGLILPPQESFGTKIEFDFSEFTAVTIGYTLEAPKLHRVGNNVFASVQMAYRKLQDRSYRRIALVVDEEVDCRVSRAFSAGYGSMSSNQQGVDTIPAFVCEGFDDKRFGKWYERWLPEVIMGTGPTLEEGVRPWLKRRGETPAIAELNLSEEGVTDSGVDQQLELIGKTAVSLVFSQISHFEYGIPETPLLTLVDGIWRDGERVP